MRVMINGGVEALARKSEACYRSDLKNLKTDLRFSYLSLNIIIGAVS